MERYNKENPRSKAWYLLPLFLGLIGGLISYVIIRHDDPTKAKKCLYVGVILTTVPTVLGLVAGLM